MDIFALGLIAGLVYIWIVRANKRNETLDAAGKDARQCPHCAEHIKAAAVVCRYCGRDVPPEATVETPPPPQLRPWIEVFGLTHPRLWAAGMTLSFVGVVLLIALIGG